MKIKNFAQMQKLAALHGWICQWCGLDISLRTNNEPTLVKLALRGPDALWNMALSCGWCARAKGRRSAVEFQAWLARLSKK